MTGPAAARTCRPAFDRVIGRRLRQGGHMALRFLVARPTSDLVRLPWDQPLELWDESHLVPLARGLSRHVVRFVRVSGEVIAIKETRQSWAEREYAMLRNLHRMGLPTVEAVGIVTGRESPDGEPIEPALLTRHLPRSLPYRSLFSHRLQDDTLDRVLDALVVLMVRLHLEGFYWGDCSLSNTLFRRSAGDLAAYLVDAETGELHHKLSDGQRDYDVDLLRSNVYGEMLDLQAGGLLDPELDPLELVDRVVERYSGLWDALTGAEEFGIDEMWRIEQRVERLNELGFDVDELDIVTDIGGASVRIQPKVVEADHHARRLQGLTGLDVEESQARRLLNDFDAYAASREMQAEDPTVVAHSWLTNVYEPLQRLAPPEAVELMEAPELFHDVLLHRWYLSERAGREVDFFDVARDYVKNVLPGRIEELRDAETRRDTDLFDAIGD
jgi:hypothetical protein